ncbi:MAG: hypothetical protein WAO58_06455 [Fimbriimonadaceae bacterium]
MLRMNLGRMVCVLLVLLGTGMMKLQAGYYATTLTGGGPVEIIPTGGSPWYLNYWSDDPQGKRTGFSFSGVPGPPPAAGPGSVKCEGTITCTFTWTASYLGDPEPPPSKAVIKKYALASFIGRTGSCSNGLGDAPVGDPTSQISEGTTYEIKSGTQAQMQTFNITITPYAQATLDDPPLGDGIMAAAAEVLVDCDAAPPDIQLSGGINPTWQKRYLIGQLCNAIVRSPLLNVDTWSWAATGGAAFKTWTATRDTGGPMVPLGSETGSAFEWHFKTPSGIARATCNIHLYVPPGSKPVGGINTSLQRNCLVDPPQSKSLSAYMRSNAGQYASQNYGQPPPPGYPYPANGVGLYWEPSVSVLSILGVDVPAGYPPDNVVGMTGPQ